MSGGTDFTSWNVAKRFKDALLANAALHAWCQETYGRNCKVQLGMNPRHLPDKNDAPYVAVMPLGNTEGETKPDFDFRVRLVVGVDDAEKAVSGDGEELLAYERIDTGLAPLVLAACRGAVSKSLSPVGWEIIGDFFPLVEEIGEITITVPRTQGGRMTL